MRHSRLQPGQIGVILTLIIATLLGAVAMGTDVAVLYFNWVQLQKAADSAALAGAGELTALPDPSGTVATNAISTGEGYACLNGINDPSNTNATLCPSPVNNPSYVDKVTSTTVNANNTQFSIKLTRQVPYYFARVIGLQTGNVAAGATAQVLRGANQVNGGLFPTLFQCKSPCNGLGSLDPGTFVSFGQKFTAGAPGNWGWLNIGQGPGGNALKDAIINGYSGTVSVGDTLTTDPGQKTGPINQGWAGLFAKHNSLYPNVSPSSICANVNPNNIPAGDPLLVTVPVADLSGCTGACSVSVEGFAEVYLTSGSDASISGCFVQEVSTNSVGGSGAPVLGALGVPTLIQ
jgi:hypothetical protein